MIYFTVYRDWNDEQNMTSAVKGMGDIFAVYRDLGYESLIIDVARKSKNLKFQERLMNESRIISIWRQACNKLRQGDSIIITIPMVEKFLSLGKILKELKQRGVEIILFMADPIMLREVHYRSLTKRIIIAQERQLMKYADKILAHNDIYAERLRQEGARCPIYSWGLFDYLTDSIGRIKKDKNDAVIIATNLIPIKAGYAYRLPDNCRFNLYGPNFQDELVSSSSSSHVYRGAFEPDELPEQFEGGWGLLWDGDSPDTCNGNYGDYMRINTPHRIGLFLANGYPVIVWDEAAIADFVVQEGCGITVSKLSEIADKVNTLSQSEYLEMCENAERIGGRLRRGAFTREVMEKAVGRPYDYLVVGAGIYGASVARSLADKGKKVLVVDRRQQPAGNCYTERIDGIDVHRYGAHIFHTDYEDVWEFVNRFAEFNDYRHHVKAEYKGEQYDLPFNMNTFRQLWGLTNTEDVEAKLNSQRLQLAEGATPRNLEEHALSIVGRDVYETLIKGYTEKQWGRPCCELPSAILKRIPLRMEYNNDYFADKYQGIPIDGYTEMIENMLDGIDQSYGVDYIECRDELDALADKVIYSGSIDELYGYRYGRLEYRTVEFETERLETSDYQGQAVINYTDSGVPWTRIIEHKWFTSAQAGSHSENENCPYTIISKEYSRKWEPGMEAYYPVNDDHNEKLYERYQQLLEKEDKIIIGGRLGAYKYYDMDDSVRTALELVSEII